MSRSARLSAGVAVVAMSAALTLAAAGSAAAAVPTDCDTRVNNSLEKLLACVDSGGVLEHLGAFQAIADANGGNRAAGTAGYDRSVNYVVQSLTAAGWAVRLDQFDFTYVGPATLQ